MSKFLFIYGTLLPELAPLTMHPLLKQLRLMASGNVRGRLYDLGAYPGAITDEQSDTVIVGRVFALPADEAVLTALDKYEVFDPAAPDESLFVRTSCCVCLADESRLTSWIYVYNRPVSNYQHIADGNYLRYLASKVA